jgi:S1-C subfamily serine protease
VVTAAHVLNKAKRIVVLTSQGRRLRATVQATDPVSDLAVLVVDETLPAELELGTREGLRRGSEVLVCGYPMVERLVPPAEVPPPAATCGPITLVVDRPGESLTYFVMRAPVTDGDMQPRVVRGNSGAPVCSTRDGRVLGVLTGLVPPTGGAATGVRHLRALLSSLQSK